MENICSATGVIDLCGEVIEQCFTSVLVFLNLSELASIGLVP